MALFDGKVFKAFNCTRCKQPLSAAHLYQIDWTSEALCHNCCNSSALGTNNPCGKSGCIHGVRITYVVKDLLASVSPSTDSKQNGYTLSKPVSIPECAVCHEEYTDERGDVIPTNLPCRHTLCYNCFEKMKKTENGFYSVTCPLCGNTSKTCEYSKNQLLITFLRELRPATNIICQNCQRSCVLRDTFHCNNCQVNACATCIVLDHQNHKLTRMIKIEAKRVSEECHGIVKNQIATYEKTFPVLHQEIQDKIDWIKKETLKRSSETLKLTLDTKSISAKLEAISEEYLAKLRSFGVKMQPLSKGNLVEAQTAYYQIVFQAFHQKIQESIDRMKQRTLEKAESMSELSKIESVKQIDYECKEVGKEFEKISEEYLPQLRNFVTKLESLCKEIEAFPT